MAAPAVLRVSGPPLCPSFAEVCSFLERYGPALDLPEMTFPQMERYLRDTTAVPKPLVELHVKLLRKLGRSVTTDRWEKYLAKVCQELNSTWAWELEQKGYQEMSMECKSSILKYLCECQFDDNLKFKTLINDEDPEKMRLLPIGRDRQGLIYWFQLDQEQNIRLYTEEQDDLDGSTWKCIVRNRNDLADALDLLKAQVEPSQKDQNQTNSRSPSPTGKDAGEDPSGNSDIKPNKGTENEAMSKQEEMGTEEKPKTQVVKQEEAPLCRQKDEPQVKEEKMEEKLSAFDNRVSTITAIKSEAKNATAPQNAVSVVMATHMTFTKINKEEEAERAVVRSNQQAKIPLKKRDLKLAESFQNNHVNSSIIVCNPSVIQSKDGRAKEENFLTSLGGQAVPPPQLLGTASRPESTNGRSSLPLTHKEGQNGVVGVLGHVGVVGHVGVIRSPPELLRTSEQQDQNGPSSEPPETLEEEAKRQSVVVRKGGGLETEMGSTPSSVIETQTLKNATFSKPEELSQSPERKVDSGISPPSEEEKKKQCVEDQDKKPTGEKCEKIPEDQHVGHGTDPEKINSTLGNTDEESKGSVGLSKVTKRNRKEEQEDVLVGEANPKELLEEASSELQKEGIRLKIKIPPHRRNKLKEKGVKVEEKKREQEVQDEGRTLRRSSRICRSFTSTTDKPSSKATAGEKKKPPKKQNVLSTTREEQDDEEEEEQSSKNDRKAEMKLKKRRGKRRSGRPRWSNTRTKKRKGNEGEVERSGEGDGGSESEESIKSEKLLSEDACSHCGLPNHPELILLCDSCDNGYHTACLRPPLMLIPDGEWFCPPCQHKLLCEKLEEQLQNLDSALKKRERAERRRERLVYVGISVENIIPEGDEEEEEKSAKKKDPKKSKNLGRRSTRTRKHISYRFDDFDDAIDEAIEEDAEDLCDGAGKGKDITSVISGPGKESKRPIREQSRAARNKRRRRLNDLESDSTAAESEDEFMLSNSSEDEDFAASGGEDEEDEDVASDGGSWDRGNRPKRREEPKSKRRRNQRRGRKRRRRCSTEEEEDDSEEEMDSDQFSDMTDSEAEKKRRGLRRGQHQQVNYRETSESSDNSRTSATKQKVKGRGRPRKERQSSDYSDASPSSRESEEEDEEEEKNQRRRAKRLKAEEFLRRRLREKQSRYKDDEDEEERERRLKKKRMEKDRRRLTEEEENVEMGRGRRREILSQQRQKRLAQMLQKRRPSTDEDEEDSEDSESSSEEDRPVRKRLNRIDSDEEEEDEDEEESGGRQKTTKRISAAELKSDDGQEKGRGHSSSPSNRTPKGSAHTVAGSPTMPQGGDRSAGQDRNYLSPRQGGEEEEARSGSVDSFQNSPQS